jgi:Mannosyl-glycoprotein endo-beta-N-acetylglucosaminidase
MPQSLRRLPARLPIARLLPLAAASLTLPAIFFASHAAVGVPEIRISDTNRVPACVTPDRLMTYLMTRNPALDPRYKSIAADFRKYGEALRIRWDYAFYQMLLETNSLKFGGDVKARQNNFAGLGATGGGVRGESFPDVSTGVLAQLQHLVAYSGERVESPVATRTRENQDEIIKKSAKLGRPVRFADLTNRWAADRKYIRSIEALAGSFTNDHCTAPEPVAREQSKPAPRPAERRAEPKPETARPEASAAPSSAELLRRAVAEGRAANIQRSNLGIPPRAAATPACQIWRASYGGTAAVLIRAEKDGAEHLTVLGVERGAEDKLARSFITTHASGGTAIATFASEDAALADALTRCPN